MNKLLYVFLVMITYNLAIYSQSFYSFLKFNPSTGIVSDEEVPIYHTDPNIVYWSNNIKQNGLPVLEFNTYSVPLELLSYQSQIASQASDCVSQWNTYGCLNIDYNTLYGAVSEFSEDNDLFPSTTDFGVTLFAVVQSGSNYQLEIYPGHSLSYPYTTILLNKSPTFYAEGFEWTAAEQNQGTTFIPFKSIYLHEMGHLLGLGHIFTDQPIKPLLYFNTLLNQFLFDITSTDLSALSELCSFNGTPTGVEDYIWITENLDHYDVNHYYVGSISRIFVDIDPIPGDPDYIVSWDNWKITTSYGCGEVLLYDNPSGFFEIPSLPLGYNWLRDENGYVIGTLSTGGTDNDGFHHSASLPIKIGNVPNTFITSGTLSFDTHWCGDITLTGSITVPTGVILTVYPGAIIKFPNNSSLIVNGKLDALGCTFVPESAGTSPKSWGSISLNGSGASGSTIEYANIYYGTRVEAINISNITIQNCNFLNNYDAVYFYNSSGSILNNTITSNSIGHGIRIEGFSTATCNQNVVTKTSTSKTGVGILYGGGSGGSLWQNDINGWSWGVGAIWGASPDFRIEPLGSQNRSNRIKNCNYGVYAYNNSWPVLGAPVNGYCNNSIFSNIYKNVYFTSGGALYAYANYWGGPPTSSMFYLGSGCSIVTTSWLSTDPWAGLLMASGDENNLSKGEVTYPSSIESDDFLYGVELRLNGKYREAMNFFITYIDEHPDEQAAYVELYNCFHKETADDLINFFNLLPKHAMAEHKLLLSYMFLRRGNVEMAKKVNNNIIRTNPGTQLSEKAKINNLYISLYNENDFGSAVSIFNNVLTRAELTDEFDLSLVQQDLESYAQMHGIEFGNVTIPKRNSETVESGLPVEYALLGNYPNPFNPNTTISYALPYQSSVEVVIYDIIGRVVKSFDISSQSAGYQSIFWDGRNEIGNSVASGIYLYRISIKSLENHETFVKTAKLMMLK